MRKKPKYQRCNNICYGGLTYKQKDTHIISDTDKQNILRSEK